MLLKLTFLTCLSIGLSLAATVPVNRAVTQNGQELTITLEDEYPTTKLAYTCGSGGSITLVLTSESTTGGTGGIEVGTADIIEDSCKKLDIAYPNNEEPGANTVGRTLTITGDACGRQVAADNTGFEWNVTIIQEFAGAGDSVRSFVNPITAKCEFAAITPSVLPVPADTAAPDDLFLASNTLPVTFTLTKIADGIRGKWNFELKPENVNNIAGPNADFKIVDCTATANRINGGPEESPKLTAPLIAGSCVLDRGTKVDTTTSPTSQAITVTIFQFSNNPTGEISLQCTVALCTKGSGDPTCPQVGAFGSCPTTPAPEGTLKGRFQRSAVPQLYLASTKW